MESEGVSYVSPWQWWPNAVPEVTVRDLAPSSGMSSSDEEQDFSLSCYTPSSDPLPIAQTTAVVEEDSDDWEDRQETAVDCP
eukprot:744017-Amphidinium_carterae.2